MNIPNTLSVIRILTVPVIVLLIINSNARNYPVLITVYFLSMLLDFFDGYLARKLKQETELGKILDPVADKLMVFSIIIALAFKTDFPVWLAVVIISRDLLILLAGAIILKGKKFVTPSILIGKITFAVLGRTDDGLYCRFIRSHRPCYPETVFYNRQHCIPGLVNGRIL